MYYQQKLEESDLILTELENEEDQTMCCIYSMPRIDRQDLTPKSGYLNGTAHKKVDHSAISSTRLPGDSSDKYIIKAKLLTFEILEVFLHLNYIQISLPQLTNLH